MYIFSPLHSMYTLLTGEPVEVTRWPPIFMGAGKVITTLVSEASDTTFDIAVSAVNVLSTA